jgi:3D (Asp-Asp-Asp) domain-containing protein
MTGLIVAWTALSALLTPADGYCYAGLTTGYVRTEHGARTFDGTPITTDEAIAAAGWDIPIDSYVTVDGAGPYRVADRGRLAPGQVDVAVWSRAEAFELTGVRTICVSGPGE